jgi:bifunctional DNase/RNase
MSNAAERRPSVRMTVGTVVMDPVSNMPVVILQDDAQTSFLPIWIGVCEANAISLVLEGVPTPRPMTHDLIRELLGATGFAVDHILIHTLSDSVFLASIHLVNGAGEAREVDSRPSDALALALRTNSAVLVDPDVLTKAVVAEPSQDEAMRSILERLRPEDLGEYEM